MSEFWKPVRVGKSVRYAFEPEREPTPASNSMRPGSTRSGTAATRDGFVEKSGGPTAPKAASVETRLESWQLAAHDFMRLPARLGWQTRGNLLPALRPDPEVLATAPHSELLDWLANGLPKDFFKGVTILAAQHGVETQELLFAKFIELGADPRDIYWAPIPYSTDFETEKRVAQYGVNVIQPPGSREFHERGLPGPSGEAPVSRSRRANLYQKMLAWKVGVDEDSYKLGTYDQARKFQIQKMLQVLNWERPRPGSPILVLDDGGLLLRSLHEEGLLSSDPQNLLPTDPNFFYTGIQHLEQGGLALDLLQDVTGVEQTTRGVTELSDIELQTTVVDVAKSSSKKVEAPYVAESLWTGLLPMLADLGFSSGQGKTVVQVGYGTLGQPAAEIARALGFKVIVADTSADQRQLAADAGFETSPSAAAVAPRADVLLAITGHLSITQEVLENLKEGAVVASGSSGEVEGDVHFLARRHTSLAREIEFTLDDHDVQRRQGPDEVTGLRTHFLGDKRFYVVQGLRPVNFLQGPETIPLRKIELTRATMFGAAVQALLERGRKGLVPLEGSVQDALLARFLRRGLEVTTLHIPKWPDRTEKSAHLAQWQKLTGLLAKKASAYEIQATVNAFEAALGAPEVYPPTPSDAAKSGVVFRLPSGELMLAAQPVPQFFSAHLFGNEKQLSNTAPGLFQTLPIRDETPRRLELMGRKDADLIFMLQTVDAKGKKRVHVLRSPEVGVQIGLNGRSDVQLVRTFEDAEVLSTFVRDQREGQKLGSFTELPSRTTGRIPRPGASEETRVLLRCGGPRGRVVDLGTEETFTWQQPVETTFGDRAILSKPLRVAVRTNGELHELTLPKNVTGVRELVSHFNRDLLRATTSDGEEILLPLRWPVQWRSTAWPPGESARGNQDLYTRSIFSPGHREDALPPLEKPTLGAAVTLPSGFELRRLEFDEDEGAWKVQVRNPSSRDEPDAWDLWPVASP